MFHETLDPSWNNLLENTFNQVSDILGETVEEIDFEEQMPDEASVVNIDSRLDSDSVLIEDIALDIIRGKDTVISVDEAVTQKTVITELKPHILKMEMGECFNNSGENNLQSFQRGTAYNLERRDDLSPLPMGDGRDALADSIHPMEDSCADLGTDLQPHLRDRCNTWPRRQLESCYSSCSSEEGDRLALPQDSPPPLSSPRSQAPGLALVSEEGDSDGEREEDFPTRGQDGYRPKLNSRRNPWGNFSYAELITQAVQSSPEHRLTLSQIYDWMISTVPYFQERADPSASAGWKNSIRHNLSLHQRFVKVQNEGAGKSSWWTINPEKRTVMKPRRRATSGDTRTMSIKRDKAKKRTEALKSGGRLIRSTSINGINPPLSPLYDSRVPPHFNYHDNGGSASYVTQLRARSLSNASSLGCPSFLQQPPEDQNQLNFPNLDYLNTLNTIKREEAEWENIAMDNLHLDGKAPMMNQREMIRGREELEDYLQPQPGPVLSEPGRRHKIKILEPRNPVCAAVLPNQSKSTQQQYNYNEDLDSYVSPLLTRDEFDQNEVRRPLIIKELNQLTRKKAEVIDNQNTHILTDNNKKNLESAFDIKIRMLQEELDKMSREEEINRINQFSKASNNPYFTGNTGMGRQEPFYSHQHMSYNECMMQYLPMEVMEHSDGMDADRDPDVMQQVLDQELRNLDRRNFEYSDIRNPFNRLPEVTT